MNMCISTTLAHFKLMNIKPNFSELAGQLGIDRHTLKNILMQEELNQEKEDVYISELDYYKDIIEEKLEIKGIYLFLKETKNLKYSYSNFEKYMKKQNYKIKNVTSDMMSPK